ncbi:hypothetical protein M0802_015355 [Mischocyttarus mexicanus]|nr:hypothetical protein M0802_015358 [Mischocyttarus mexicanus]KAI4474985.1 hypothetical protein M0802_015355 [Mischocyttarus mexicanus]
MTVVVVLVKAIGVILVAALVGGSRVVRCRCGTSREHRKRNYERISSSSSLSSLSSPPTLKPHPIRHRNLRHSHLRHHRWRRVGEKKETQALEKTESLVSPTTSS